MGDRLALQTLLESISGVSKVYFQPPASVTLLYPCIIFSRNDINIKHADNSPYAHKIGYSIMVIDRSPNSLIPNAVAAIPTANFDRSYMAEGLYHDIFTIYF